MSQPPHKPMKLKLNTGGPKPPPTPSEQSATPGGGFKIKLKAPSAAATPATEGAPSFPAPAIPPVKEKRKYTKKNKTAGEEGAAKPKKRARDANDDGAPSSAKKAKAKQGGAAPAPARGLSIKLKNKPAAPAVIPRLKVKHVGQPPPRPPGVGYDSEAEDVEIDPAIEHQFILRMLPGDDCDYLRKAITEKRLGVPVRDGGADVQFRFFDREGRRACVTIQGHKYAASLVDLPCVVEGMKSWEKKGGWFKTSDICQMLLVLGPVDNEDAAKDYPLPREVEKDTYQYAHGLTPPMHYVRKRRFRKRVSHRTIEAVEEEVDRLLAMDQKVRDQGGDSTFEMVDLNRQRSVDEQDTEYDQMMASGNIDENGNYVDDVEEEPVDVDLAAMLEAELAGAEDEPITSVEAPTANDIDAAHAVATHVLGSAGADGDAATPSANETEDSESDEDEEEEVDEAALLAQQEAQQQREEIADLEREVENARLSWEGQNNPMLKARLLNKYKSLQSDLELKRSSLGENWDD